MSRGVPSKFGNVGKNHNQKISQAQEKRGSKLSGGLLTPGSGNKGIKGDFIARGAKKKRMVEAKVTGKKQFTLKRKWLTKVCREAYEVKHEPVLMFGFAEMPFGPNDWGAVPFHRLEELFELEQKYYELLKEVVHDSSD